MTRPNFLFFITDQQRHDHVGYAGNPVLKTPHIDALAAKGTWFSRFHVASPVCMPNRATFMTGRMPSLHGVRHNGIALDLDRTTFVDLLRAAGYHTGLIGKCHLQNFVGEPPGYEPKCFDNQHTPPPAEFTEAWRARHSPQRYDTEQRKLWRQNPNRKVSLPYYGFEHVELCVGHGDNVSGHYDTWLTAQSNDAVARFGLDHAEETSTSGAPQAYKPARRTELYPTTYVRNRTQALLEQHAEHPDRPFFIQCAFPDPHHPFTPPGDYWSRYQPENVDLPRSFGKHTDYPAIPPMAYLVAQHQRGEGQLRWTSPFIADERQARDIIAKTYGQIAMVDDAIGDIMSTLNGLGLADNTVVCFMSDHGDWMGDHSLFLKGPLHFQSLLRTPFVWRDPAAKRNTGRVDALAGTLDLARTILSRAGLRPFNGVQGVNLLPVMRDPTQLSSRSLLIEQQTQYSYLGFDEPVRLSTIVTATHRMTVWEGHEWGELYDLESDPQELENLWDKSEAQATRNQLMQTLVNLMMNHQDWSPHPTDKG